MATEPGLDKHEWESEMQGLEEEIADAPFDVLPELDDLVGRMLGERGFAIDDAGAAEGEEPEVLAEFRAAREITRLVDRGADVSPGDVAAAINGYRAVYDYVLAERPEPSASEADPRASIGQFRRARG
jgi:hypothetical protein